MGGDAAAFPAGAVASVAAAGRDGVGAGGGSPPVGWAVPIRTTCPPPEAITSVEEKKGRGGGARTSDGAEKMLTGDGRDGADRFGFVGLYCIHRPLFG
jgi:hypothetical protein